MATQTITLSGIASAEVHGSLAIRGGVQTLFLRGIASQEAHGFLSLGISGDQPLRVFLAGVSCRLDVDTLTIARRAMGGSTSSFTLQWRGMPVRIPTPFQEVRITEGGRNEFLGFLNSFKHRVEDGTMSNPLHRFECSARDLSALMDKRFFTKIYPAGPAKDILIDIASNFLDGENLTTHGIRTTATIPAELSFKNQSVTAAYNQVCGITGDFWGVDANRDIYCYVPGAGPAAPFGLTDTSDNVLCKSMSVDHTGIGFVNSSIGKTDKNLG